jgi:hypothetical protein
MAGGWECLAARRAQDRLRPIMAKRP